MIGSHTIPEFYLKQFASAATRKGRPGKVWVYQKGKQAHLRSTDSQGYENGYFGYLGSDGSLDESLEEYLAKRENECNDILISSKSELCDLRSLINRNKLSFYIALLFARSTSRRKFSAGNWQKLKEPYSKLAHNEDYTRDAAEHFSEAAGHPISLQQIQEMIRKQAEWFSQKQAAKNFFIKDLLFHVEVARRNFVLKPWQVWEAPTGSEFVTSDNPIVTAFRVNDEIWHPGHGFNQPNVVTAFPLCPTTCLLMGIVGREFERVTEAEVMLVNEIVVRCSDRFVYARTPSDRLAEMVETVAGTSVPGKNAFIGPFPDEKQIEDHLRRIMGIKRRQRLVSIPGGHGDL